MEKKKTHTNEEILELNAWFESVAEKLPETMQIDKSTYTPNLKRTVDILLEQIHIFHKNSKMQGAILILKKIKNKIEEMNTINS